MKKVFIFVPALALFVFSLLACTRSAAPADEPLTGPEVKTVANLELTGEDAGPAITSIRFDETKFNFGEKKVTEDFSHTFTFTNTGEHDLVIEKAQASCSCTVSEYTREAVKPGEKGIVTAKFNPKDDYQGAFVKTVTVIANTEPRNIILEIAGEVVN